MKKVNISDLQKGQEVTMHLKNGQVIGGIFQFIDGDEFDGDIVLRPSDPESKVPSLGWDIRYIGKIYVKD